MLEDEGEIEEYRRVLKDAVSEGLLDDLSDDMAAINEMSALIRMIDKLPTMPPDEKRQIIDSMYFTTIAIAQSANRMIKLSREAVKQLDPRLFDLPQSAPPPPVVPEVRLKLSP